MRLLPADRAPRVVMLVVGIYTAFVGAHTWTDVSKTVTKTEEEGA